MTSVDPSWFVHDRLGLFIHWGLYSLAARHEWVQNHERIDKDAYRRYFERFDPDLYDPAMWAATAARAGMKYFVVTTKHHEGFCLWDSRLTDYKATNTPAGRDLLTPMVEAFREQGLRVGFYHSLLDWHHDDFLIDSQHPLRDDPRREELNASRDMSRYVEYLHGQTRELLTQFGPIDIMWFDYSYPQRPQGKGRDAWQSEKLLAMVRTLQPHALVNDRLDLLDVEGGYDIKTPEQFQPRGWVEHRGKRVVWEACHTFSGSWGYHRDEATWKSDGQIVRMLIDTVSKGGNLLLNVGPTGRGELDERAVARLEALGAWMRRHGRSIYGCGAAPSWATAPPDCRLTWNEEKQRLYVHVFAWPFRHLHLEGLADRVAYAQLLHDASEVKMVGHGEVAEQETLRERLPASLLTLELPVQRPNVTVPVVELFLR